MASYEQVIKFENEKPQGVIRLVESNGFYRAYNYSAYMFHQVIAQHKVTRKFVKNINQEIVYVGFPVDKLLERIGDRSRKKTELGCCRTMTAAVCERCWLQRADYRISGRFQTAACDSAQMSLLGNFTTWRM